MQAETIETAPLIPENNEHTSYSIPEDSEAIVQTKPENNKSIRHSMKKFYTTHKKKFQTAGYAGIGAFSLVPSVIYGSLAADDSEELSWQIIYFISSFGMNFPQCVYFVLEGKEVCNHILKKIFKEKKVHYVGLIAISAALSFITTLAGVALAIDGIQGSNWFFIQKLGWPGVIAMSGVTFIQRLVGVAVNLESVSKKLYEILLSLYRQCRGIRSNNQGLLECYTEEEILSMVEQDIITFALKLGDKKNPINFDDLRSSSDGARRIGEISKDLYRAICDSQDPNIKFITFVSQAAGQMGQSSIEKCLSKIFSKDRLVLLAYRLLTIWANLLLTPMWLRLAEFGTNEAQKKFFSSSGSLQEPLGNNATLVWLAATPNALFCLLLCNRLIPEIVTGAKKSIIFTHSKVKGSVLSILSFMLLFFIGYQSGAGIGYEAQKMLDQGAGHVANTTFYNVPLLSETVRPFDSILPYDGMIVAGIGSNVSSAISLFFGMIMFLIGALLLLCEKCAPSRRPCIADNKLASFYSGYKKAVGNKEEKIPQDMLNEIVQLRQRCEENASTADSFTRFGCC